MPGGGPPGSRRFLSLQHPLLLSLLLLFLFLWLMWLMWLMWLLLLLWLMWLLWFLSLCSRSMPELFLFALRRIDAEARSIHCVFHLARAA